MAVAPKAYMIPGLLIRLDAKRVALLAKAEATVEELVGMIERGELRFARDAAPLCLALDPSA